MAKVLVVDDDYMVRELLVYVIDGMGHTTSEACNGEEGVKIFLQECPDLIITDFSMPEMDGGTMVAAIRQFEIQNDLASQVPVVLITGDRIDKPESVSIMLHKPVELAKIRKAVDQFLQ